MAVQMGRLMLGAVGDLRVHPVAKRIRATYEDLTVADSQRAMLVWEPRRVVASYAVPVEDVVGDLLPFEAEAGDEMPVRMGIDGPPVLDPRTPFTVHTCPGTAITIRTPRGQLPGAAFAADDDDLHGYVVLDWEAFTHWREEDEYVVGHPHDPFDRIDCLRSSRHIVVSVSGQILADTTTPTLLFETPLPTRYYLPRSDVRMDLFEQSNEHTVCAYKGTATYWSAVLGDHHIRDIAWSYEDPLHDALPVKDMISFFTERVDVTMDGVPLERPVTPWS